MQSQRSPSVKNAFKYYFWAVFAVLFTLLLIFMLADFNTFYPSRQKNLTNPSGPNTRQQPVPIPPRVPVTDDEDYRATFGSFPTSDDSSSDVSSSETDTDFEVDFELIQA